MSKLPHQSAAAINLMGSATLHETIMIVVRAFDDAGRSGAFRSNRVSFPILHDLVRQPGVIAELEHRARGWFDGFNSEESVATVRKHLDRFERRLSKLRKEKPNRIQLLRDFRDEFLAHNLEMEAERKKPQFRHVTEILGEMTELSNDAELVFRGSDVSWELLDEQIKGSADALWMAIDQGTGNQG